MIPKGSTNDGMLEALRSEIKKADAEDDGRLKRSIRELQREVDAEDTGDDPSFVWDIMSHLETIVTGPRKFFSDLRRTVSYSTLIALRSYYKQ